MRWDERRAIGPKRVAESAMSSALLLLLCTGVTGVEDVETEPEEAK